MSFSFLLTPQVASGTHLSEGDTTSLIHSTLSTLASKAASPTKRNSSGSKQNTSSNQIKRDTSSSSIKRDTSSSSVSDKRMGPDLSTRGEGNELKDVFAKLQKKTAAEEVQMHLAQMVGESADLELAETMSEASTKGMEKHGASITISDEVVFVATIMLLILILGYCYPMTIIQIELNQPCDIYDLCLMLMLKLGSHIQINTSITTLLFQITKHRILC